MSPPLPTSVFISYKSEDHDRVLPLVLGLRGLGHHVWWDRDVQGTQSWRQEISEHLDDAACVLVCWTHASAALPNIYVHDEARRAQARGVLLQVRLDDVSPPLGFGEAQSLPLLGWSGKPSDPFFQDVAAAARALCEGGQMPRPLAPLRRRRRWLSWGALATGLLALGLFLLDIGGLQRALCALPVLRAGCRAAALGHVPSQAEERDWRGAQASMDCGAHRAYLARYPTGAYAAEAQARLAARIQAIEGRWGEPKVMRLPFYLQAGSEPVDTEARARAQALARGEAEARSACEGYEQSEGHALLDVAQEPRQWHCRAQPGGWVCGFDGKALCTLRILRQVEVETCPGGASPERLPEGG